MSSVKEKVSARTNTDVYYPRSKISMISEISVVQKHGNFDGNIGILSISIKIE